MIENYSWTTIDVYNMNVELKESYTPLE